MLWRFQKAFEDEATKAGETLEAMDDNDAAGSDAAIIRARGAVLLWLKGWCLFFLRPWRVFSSSHLTGLVGRVP